MQRRLVIGILGGMGPEATADFFTKIVRSTPATKDRDHFRIIIDNNPAIPSRQEALLGKGPSPVPMLIETAKNLEEAGANFIVMPCNSAHCWIEEIRKGVRIPVVDMVEEAAKQTARQYPKVRTVGVMAAAATRRLGLYEKQFRKLGIKTISPTEDDQTAISKVINSVKAGDLRGGSPTAVQIGQRLVGEGAEAIIAGCTELPLVLKTGDLPVPIIDATQVLASRAVELAQAQRQA